MRFKPTETLLDPYKIRSDFPILQERVTPLTTGEPFDLVYLDNAATTQKPRQVIEAIVHYYHHQNANVHRTLHELGERATLAYERGREKVAGFIRASSIREIVFTRGTTEAINLVANAWGRKFLEGGDEVLLSEMEHHSNLIPWQMIAREKGAHLKFIPIHSDGTLDLTQLDELLTREVKFVAIAHMSNVLGTINPIGDIIEKAHRMGIPVLIDAAQSVPHLPVDVQKLDCDFLAFSGHKMCGPTGIGVLYARENWLQEMDPYQGGGEMIASVSLESATWNDLPYKFEAGTPNIAGVVALAAAIDYLNNLGMANIAHYEQKISEYALQQLQKVEGIRILGEAPQRGAVISFCLADIHPHDIAQFLNSEGIAIRAGHHCAQPLMRRLKIPASARASFYFYNTFEEVDRLVHCLQKSVDFFCL